MQRGPLKTNAEFLLIIFMCLGAQTSAISLPRMGDGPVSQGVK